MISCRQDKFSAADRRLLLSAPSSTSPRHGSVRHNAGARHLRRLGPFSLPRQLHPILRLFSHPFRRRPLCRQSPRFRWRLHPSRRQRRERVAKRWRCKDDEPNCGDRELRQRCAGKPRRAKTPDATLRPQPRFGGWILHRTSGSGMESFRCARSSRCRMPSSFLTAGRKTSATRSSISQKTPCRLQSTALSLSMRQGKLSKASATRPEYWRRRPMWLETNS
ncbi:hypothetical protein EDC40_104246 [Aminobacter aminovorans]|uniref:Uncharacterized protein n=1 Tax=Aminobacter aminovorans TaxID=83263 RepID=A0A380WIJ0_AMIAI|nr:hypothetical protein EDC40_104246 [Aminobacter aminovorans]SUU88162.1 Uncharacterised protein [Aminobacter aminovorans]